MAGGLSEDKKLVWLGFKNPQQDENQATSEIQNLKDNVGNYSTFQADLNAYDLDGDGDDENISSFTEFKTYLEDNGFQSLEADAFIDKIKNNFEDSGGDGSKYDDFEGYVQNNSSSYEELQTQFNTGTGLTGDQETDDGDSAAGIQIHDQESVSKSGVNLPPATVEIYGNRIEFSQTGSVVTDEAIMSYSNLQIDDQTPNKYQTIYISADVENIGAVGGDAYPQLKIDGQVVTANGPIYLGGGASTTVEFTWSFSELTSADVTIANLPPKTVSVVPEGLV
jgi:hypothetical protein